MPAAAQEQIISKEASIVSSLLFRFLSRPAKECLCTESQISNNIMFQISTK